ncbi:MAG: hypothetical protein ACOY90_10420 [Candidatus Zhuqueibacterota bacterium]
MEDKLPRVQNSPMDRRTFLLKWGKVFGVSMMMAMTPLKNLLNLEEILFWMKFRLTQGVDTLVFSILEKLGRHRDRYFD